MPDENPVTEQNPVRLIGLELPVAEVAPSVYVRQHLDARLTPEQGAALLSLLTGLDRECARTQNGERVVSGPDAIRWLLEQLSREAGSLLPLSPRERGQG